MILGYNDHQVGEIGVFRNLGSEVIRGHLGYLFEYAQNAST